MLCSPSLAVRSNSFSIFRRNTLSTSSRQRSHGIAIVTSVSPRISRRLLFSLVNVSTKGVLFTMGNCPSLESKAVNSIAACFDTSLSSLEIISANSIFITVSYPHLIYYTQQNQVCQPFLYILIFPRMRCKALSIALGSFPNCCAIWR